MSLASVLFPDYRRKVLALLLLHPDSSYHQREIARLTETQSGTLSRELVKLVSAGLAVKTRVGNQQHFRANPDCPIFEELASILRKTSGLTDILAEALGHGDIFSTDQRDFRSYRWKQRKPFRNLLLPDG